MERLQNPFSVYDFLGYLIPGFLIVYVGLYLQKLPVVEIGSVFSDYNFSQTEDIILLIIVSYVAGHFLSYLSSITIENYSIWTLGFPSKYLFGIKPIGYWKSSWRELIGRNVLQSKRYFKHAMPLLCVAINRLIARALIGIIVFPISIFDLILGKIFSGRVFYSRKLDWHSSNALFNNITSKISGFPNIKDKETLKGKDYFRFIYHYCLEYSKGHQNKFQNYVALYGFMRAISFVFLIITWVLSLMLLLNDIDQFNWYVPLITSLFSFIAYAGYNKFSRRFTLEVLMAYSTIQSQVSDITFSYDYRKSNFD